MTIHNTARLLWLACFLLSGCVTISARRYG